MRGGSLRCETVYVGKCAHRPSPASLASLPARERLWCYRAVPMDPKRKLKGMLARIFSDGAVDEGERSELKAYLSSGALAVVDVREVFEDFVATTWRITMADGVVSDVEKKRLIEIVRELGLDASVLPAEWAKIVSEA